MKHFLCITYFFLEIWLPICKSCFKYDVLRTSIDPPYNTFHWEYSSLSRRRRNTNKNFSSKYCSTIRLTRRGALESVSNSCLTIEAFTIKIYRIGIFIGNPCCSRYRSDTREKPNTVIRKDSVWSCSNISWIDRIRRKHTPYTGRRIIFYFPTIYFITRKSEPIRISNIRHTFYPFSSYINSFDFILCISSIVDSWSNSLKKRGYSKSKYCNNYHQFYDSHSFFIY